VRDNWLVLAYQLDGRGGGDALTSEQLSGVTDACRWVHLDINHQQSLRWLKQSSGLEPVIIDALTAEETRPRIVELEEAALIILRGVNLNEDADPEDMVSIRLYVDQHRIISTRRRQLKAVTDIERRLSQRVGPKTSGELVSMLAALLSDRMEASIGRLNESTDDVEQNVIDNPDIGLRHQIVEIRKQAIVFRRYLSPQRDVLAKLRTADLKLFSAMDKRYFQETYDRTLRYVEDLDAARERAQIVQDELTTQLTDRLNKNTYLLSVIAAIFLPLGFLTGLLGINVGGLPGADNPLAFWLFSLMLLLLVTSQVLIFKWRKWF